MGETRVAGTGAAGTDAAGTDAARADAAGTRVAEEAGTLYLVATPIGNLEDLTYRAARVLREVDLIAAEDTRAARVLLARYGIDRPLLSYHDWNEDERAEKLLGRLRRGERIALVSEAGTPGVSDPGYRLVERCRAAGVRVEAVPGPSAVITALVSSGLPTDRFLFLGFPPRSESKRQEAFARLRSLDATLVLYEAPPRVGETLADLLAALGDREAAVCRELTKIHEEVVRGRLSELSARYADERPRGEVTLVVAGAQRGGAAMASDEGQAIDLGQAVREALEAGKSPKEIAAELSLKTGLPRRRIYQLAIAVKR